jgi:hypothetical protein
VVIRFLVVAVGIYTCGYCATTSRLLFILILVSTSGVLLSGCLHLPNLFCLVGKLVDGVLQEVVLVGTMATKSVVLDDGGGINLTVGHDLIGCGFGRRDRQ